MSLKKKGFFKYETYNKYKLLFKIFNLIKLIFLSPIIFIIILIYPIFKLKFGIIYTKTIGNSVLATEIFYYEVKEKIIKKNKNEIYIWHTQNLISNHFWYEKIKSKLVILPGFFCAPIFNFFNSFKFGKKFIISQRSLVGTKNPNLINSISDLGPHCDIYGVLKKNPPLINFNQKEKDIGNSFLEKNKILQNDKIICIHVRTTSYRDEKKESSRNSSIENFSKAINFFTKQGFKVIRMGRNENKEYKIENDNFFDYSASTDQNDFLDFFIISKCSIFIGAASGLIHVAKVFRKPILVHNLIYLPDMIQFDGEYEKIILPKKLYDRNLNKFINYNEMFDQNYNKYRTEESYDLNDIDIIENNVDEIYQASVEMYNLVIKNEKIKFDQEEFYKIFNIYYDNPLVNKTKISNKFYLENKILFKKEN